MCKCKMCDCWYCNCCKSWVGQGQLYLCCGYICYDSPTNLMPESCKCCCINWFCCQWTGCGALQIGFSQICCAPDAFDNPAAEEQVWALNARMKQNSIGQTA